MPACSSDCLWGPWTGWTPCTASCGGGTVSRTFPSHRLSFKFPFFSSFYLCYLQLVSLSLNLHYPSRPSLHGKPSFLSLMSCYVNSVISLRISFLGTRTQTPAQNGGLSCVGDSSESLACNTAACSTGTPPFSFLFLISHCIYSLLSSPISKS